VELIRICVCCNLTEKSTFIHFLLNQIHVHSKITNIIELFTYLIAALNGGLIRFCRIIVIIFKNILPVTLALHTGLICYTQESCV